MTNGTGAHVHRCECGGLAMAERYDIVSTVYRVQCIRKKNGLQCWAGPLRKTEKGAVDVWNRIMGQHKGRKSGL